MSNLQLGFKQIGGSDKYYEEDIQNSYGENLMSPKPNGNNFFFETIIKYFLRRQSARP